MTNFLESILIVVAIYWQWFVEAEEYNIRFELLLIGIVWFTCNTLEISTYIFDVNLLGRNQGHLVLNELKWIDFFIITLRSVFSIFITCVKNIYDSYNEE